MCTPSARDLLAPTADVATGGAASLTTPVHAPVVVYFMGDA